MKRINGCICILAMTVLILDSKTAANGIREGIALCIDSVIPSLFPFMILSSIISSLDFSFMRFIIRPIGKLCGLPAGAEAIFLLGLLGGYPTGAQVVTQAWKNGGLEKNDALRMLGFCSNAGPAFIFGIGTVLLPVNKIWIIWIIHIASAILVGIILPHKSTRTFLWNPHRSVSLPSALDKSIRILAAICGWILFFRMILEFLEKWLLYWISGTTYSLISGFLEITNGILMLHSYPVAGMRFIFMSVFLSLGGLCVAAQTLSVTKDLGTGSYFPGKILQGCISFCLAYLMQFPLFSDAQIQHLPLIHIILVMSVMVCTLIFIYSKKTVAIPRNMMYNKAKIRT